MHLFTSVTPASEFVVAPCRVELAPPDEARRGGRLDLFGGCVVGEVQGHLGLEDDAGWDRGEDLVPVHARIRGGADGRDEVGHDERALEDARGEGHHARDLSVVPHVQVPVVGGGDCELVGGRGDGRHAPERATGHGRGAAEHARHGEGQDGHHRIGGCGCDGRSSKSDRKAEGCRVISHVTKHNELRFGEAADASRASREGDSARAIRTWHLEEPADSSGWLP